MRKSRLLLLCRYHSIILCVAFEYLYLDLLYIHVYNSWLCSSRRKSIIRNDFDPKVSLFHALLLFLKV